MIGETLMGGLRTGVVVLATALLLAACSTTTLKHGHQFQESDIQQVQPGMSQEQVRSTLGSPTTTSTVNAGQAFYYISSTVQQTPWQSSTEVDRKILAVYFSPSGMVQNIANYGLKDGKVFDYISSTTPSANRNDEGLIQSLFRNLGRRGSLFGDE